MYNGNTRSDAAGVPNVDENPANKDEQAHFGMTQEELMGHVNKAQPSTNTAAANSAETRISYTGEGRKSTSQFNIVGGTIGQAAIGNTGPVVFNQKKKVFEKGSTNTSYQISGGNFSQANLGGSAVYNNDGSSVAAGDSATGKSFLTPEKLTLHILERGVTVQQLAKLLDKRYSLVNIAFALPKDPFLRDKMVDALLDSDSQMEVVQ